MVEQARAGRWAASRALQDALLMRTEVCAQLEQFGKEEGFRRRFVAAMLPMILDGAMDQTHTDMGNIQLCENGRTLRICTQRGFDEKFLKFFDTVHYGEAACGLAMRNAESVLVRDVTASAVFDPGPVLEMLLDAGVRSVLSIPLLSKSGRVLGILSTHSGRVKSPSANELKRMSHFARWAAALLEWRERPAGPPVFKNSI